MSIGRAAAAGPRSTLPDPASPSPQRPPGSLRPEAGGPATQGLMLTTVILLLAVAVALAVVVVLVLVIVVVVMIIVGVNRDITDWITTRAGMLPRH